MVRGAAPPALLAFLLLAGPFGGAALPHGAQEWAPRSTPAGVPTAHVGGTSELLLASTVANGLFASGDDGASWQSVPGFPVTRARIEFVPGDPDTGFVAGFGGVMRTRDGGDTWERVLDVARAARIDVSPRGPVLVGARYADTSNHLLVSHDQGDTWTDLGAPFPAGVPICGVAFGRTDDEVLVMTDSESWRSADAGDTWASTGGAGLDFGIEDTGEVWRLKRLAGVERTTDGGASWQPVGNMPGLALAIGARPDGGVHVATTVGVVTSTDGGATWRVLGFPAAMPTVSGIVADPADPSAALIADGRVGVARIRPDGAGARFEGMTNGMPRASLHLLAGSGPVLLAAGANGLFASRDGGALWSHAGGGLELASITSVAVAFDASTALVGGSDGLGGPAVEASVDGLAHFQQVPLPGSEDGAVVALAIDPGDALHAFAAVRTAGALHALFESTNGGMNWTRLLELPVVFHDLAYDEALDALLVATDAGVLARVEPGVWAARGPVASATALAVAQGSAYAAGEDRLWRDLAPVPLLAPWATTGAPVAAVAADGGGAWAATSGGAVLRCVGDALGGTCADASIPGRVAKDVLVTDGGDVLAATADGLYASGA